MTSSTSSDPSTLDFYREDKPQMIKKADPTQGFNEKLNGRAVMLGLVIGVATEAFTGKGIIERPGASTRQSLALPLTSLSSSISSAQLPLLFTKTRPNQ